MRRVGRGGWDEAGGTRRVGRGGWDEAGGTRRVGRGGWDEAGGDEGQALPVLPPLWLPFDTSR